jgi:hypothetical protein
MALLWQFSHRTQRTVYGAFSTQWECILQAKSPTELPEAEFHLVCRSKHGLILAYDRVIRYLTASSATAAEIDTLLRLEALIRLISLAYVISVSDRAVLRQQTLFIYCQYIIIRIV